jgi:hypothetical protein
VDFWIMTLSEFNFGEYDARREYLRAPAYFMKTFINPISFQLTARMMPIRAGFLFSLDSEGVDPRDESLEGLTHLAPSDGPNASRRGS